MYIWIYFVMLMQDVDDLMIRRFLRARDLDIEEASNLFLKYLSWRRSFVPNGSIATTEISNEIAHNKLFMQGLDKKGRPIVVCFGGRHKQNNLEEFKRILWLQNYYISWVFYSLANWICAISLLQIGASWWLAKWRCLYFFAGFVVYSLDKICSR